MDKRSRNPHSNSRYFLALICLVGLFGLLDLAEARDLTMRFEERPELSKDPIIQKQGEAIVVVRLTGKNENSTGTGFFISEDGWLITNFHVMRPALLDPNGITVKFKVASGKPIRDYEIGKCDYLATLVDICLIKLNHKPKKWFNLVQDDISDGEAVHAVWKPKLTKFFRTSGHSIRTCYLDEWKMIEFTAPVIPGASGSPLFTDDGRLAGVVTFIMDDRYYFGIAGSEVLNYVRNVDTVYSPAAYAKKFPAIKETRSKITTFESACASTPPKREIANDPYSLYPETTEEPAF